MCLVPSFPLGTPASSFPPILSLRDNLQVPLPRCSCPGPLASVACRCVPHLRRGRQPRRTGPRVPGQQPLLIWATILSTHTLRSTLSTRMRTKSPRPRTSLRLGPLLLPISSLKQSSGCRTRSTIPQHQALYLRYDIHLYLLQFRSLPPRSTNMAEDASVQCLVHQRCNPDILILILSARLPSRLLLPILNPMMVTHSDYVVSRRSPLAFPTAVVQVLAGSPALALPSIQEKFMSRFQLRMVLNIHRTEHPQKRERRNLHRPLVLSASTV
ncbi:hypothetical protein B0H21DRAFT_728276 [Amylocystis lapponica]|nr:hypothetical protein B0H21DRAFT_728276 [Amylocystis lapponica]